MNEPKHFQIDTIYNADALEWMRALPDGCVDHCLTSPPYNFCLRVLGDKYVPRSKNERNSGGDVTNKYSNGLGDSLGMDEYFEWQSACIEQMMRVSKGLVFYNIQIVSGNKPAVLRLLGRFADIVRDVLVWDKCAAAPAALPNVLNSEFELVVAFDHGNCKARQFRVFNAERGGLSNVIRVGKNRENDYRAAFPLALPTILVHNFTREGDVILDPFMGSGTTAVACHRTKRHFVGCELDPTVHKNALARISAEMAQQTLF